MAKRKAVGFVMREMGLSERRACRIVSLTRSEQQYHPLPKDDEAASKRMKELASENRCYGCLRLHAMLRREGLVVNHKRTYRLYTEQGLQDRTKIRRKLPRRDRVAPQVPERPMQRWSMDFVGDQLADYRRFRILNIVDDHSRFCPGQIVDVSIPGARVARLLDDLAQRGGLPEEIILDNSPEETSKAPAKPCSTGPSGPVCVCASSSQASPYRTPLWKVSMVDSAPLGRLLCNRLPGDG